MLFFTPEVVQATSGVFCFMPYIEPVHFPGLKNSLLNE